MTGAGGAFRGYGVTPYGYTRSIVYIETHCRRETARGMIGYGETYDDMLIF